MTDREMLELAAQAAEINIGEWTTEYYSDGPFGDYTMEGFEVAGGVWDPLNDDGDALRLAVAVKMNLWIYHDGAEVNTDEDPETYNESNWEDVAAATRRAIVRAAAAITVLKP